MNQTHDDEMDLFELLEILWSEKWLIACFTAFSLLVGASFLGLKEAEYESKINIAQENIPPFYDYEKVISDFEKLFYSSETFGGWKKSGGKSSLNYDDFSNTQVIDGIELSRDEADLLVVINTSNKHGKFILIRSDQPEVLDSFFNYSNKVKNLLNTNYVMRAKRELEIVEQRFANFGSAGTDNNVIKTLLSVDRFIALLESGGDVLTIEKPTIPKKSSPSTRLVLALSIILGGMFGVFLALLRSAIAKRKDRLTKA